MKLRKLVRVLHRDIGYAAAALTVLYCISGIAVNHVDDWNPNFSTSTRELTLGPLQGSTPAELEAEVIAKARLDPAEVQGRHRSSPTTFKVFLPNGGEAVLDPATGRGKLTRLHPRRIIFESNFLHLNHLKGAWTWVADIFAVALLTLAVTGLFILKGRQGLAGRGKWFTAAGAVIPAVFIAWYYYTR